MINVLGLKRLVILLVLVAFNALLGVATYLYYQPANVDVARDLRTTKSTISADRSFIVKLEQDFEILKEQKALYTDLVDLGFFTDQDRFIAPKRLERMRVISELLKARYKFSAAVPQKNDSVDKAGYVLLKTSVSVDDIEAMDDLDIFAFIYWIENAFTGQTSVTNINIERIRELDDITLNKIGKGAEIALIEASVKFDWSTMIPKEQFDIGDIGPAPTPRTSTSRVPMARKQRSGALAK